ncbi:MAG TPA: folylpolyglutamate synthase/dihydrofolate synthase family protein [Streptosporangiaceae bacterium]|nr:folylpolyglutamate synthase/dihydrofolate synthase family protein [Streptosporangiaceae bacterium]
MTANYADRLREIEKQIFARRPEHAVDPSLERIKALVTLLGDPQRAYPVIHVTGTNGKTSTARMIETLLRARGLRTGLFTSPHLSYVGERICVDGQPLDATRFVEAFDEIKPYLDLVDATHEVPLSFFEVLTGMAFSVFADAPVDVCVLEVGMGGTWDNTNVADGAVAVVTPISLDHVRYLGSTVAEIAADKSGIIKPGAIAVLAQQPPAAGEVLLRRAADVGATVAREGLEFGVVGRELAVGGQQVDIRGLLGDYPDLYLPLFGAHQAGNLACAIAAVEAFARTPDDAELGDGESAALDPDIVRRAVATMTSPGRLEVIRRSPVVIVDAAHNPGGMAASVTALTEAFSFADLIAIVAVAEDKDVAGILDELEPVAAHLVVTANSSARSMAPGALAEVAATVFGPDRVTVADRLDDAIELGVALADEADAAAEGGPGKAGVLITGSVITAGDARVLLSDRAGNGHGRGESGPARPGSAGEFT